MLLAEKGLTFKKVCILCGGPDWPTSVLTGILKLNLGDMLVGSMPVYLLIAPTVLSSSLLLRASEGPEWVTLGNLFLTVATFMQGGAGVCAAFFVNKCVDEKGAELMAMEDDAEVAALEVIDAQQAMRREVVNDWHATGAATVGDCEKGGAAAPPFGLGMKCWLLLALLLMSSSVYIFHLFPKECFQTFVVTDSIGTVLGGKASNLVKPLGWVGMALFGSATLMQWVYGKWLAARLSAFNATNPTDAPVAVAAEGGEDGQAGEMVPTQKRSIV
jgi:hypothetical protein